MKKMMVIFEIQDDEKIDKDVIPKLSHCRNHIDRGNDIFCSTPVKIIDCPEEVISIIESKSIDWKLSK